MLKLFNEIKKEVKNANINATNYIVNEVAKVVYQEVKKTQKTQNNEVNFELINEWIDDFWYAHKQAKKCSNRDTLRGYNFKKISNGEKLLEISQDEKAKKYLTEKLGDFYNFVLKHGKGYIPQNNFGRYADYIEFA